MENHSAPMNERHVPCLEHFPEQSNVAQQIPLEHFPFQIGRSISADFIIYSRQVSKQHAELYRLGDNLYIRDLKSTNGTFVNGQRVGEAPLYNGDIIHFGHKEFRFRYEPVGTPVVPHEPGTDVLQSGLPPSMIVVSQHLRELLRENCVSVVFQQIVELKTRQIMGYEALGRGTHAQLTPNPADLLRLADRCRMAPELSRLFRTVAMEESALLPKTVRFFFNIHPSEFVEGKLFDSLRATLGTLRDQRKLVLEVHEEAMVDSVMMAEMRDQLHSLGMELAYDDFGAGKARLKELVEVPPAFIKFDISLIRGIDRDKVRKELVQALIQVLVGANVQIIAEGIETALEAETCQMLGYHHGQGYYFGRPLSVAELTLFDGSKASGELAATAV
ncbi:MAG TPA: EAL domain-containing protein [Gemmataceae bacterium]|nr:EAL domain-containing protein [Gemmataceae bacterium]